MFHVAMIIDLAFFFMLFWDQVLLRSLGCHDSECWDYRRGPLYLDFILASWELSEWTHT